MSKMHSNTSKGKRPLRGDHCQCPACGEYFNSAGMFDRHRVGGHTMTPPNYGRRCLTPAEMRSKGYSMNSAGFWIRSPRLLSPCAQERRSASTPTTGIAGEVQA